MVYILIPKLHQRTYESVGPRDLSKVSELSGVAPRAAHASHFSEWCPQGRFCVEHGGNGS